MTSLKLLILILSIVLIPSCAGSRVAKSMIDANFTLTQLDILHDDTGISVTDSAALDSIRDILSRSKRIDGTLETLKFVEPKNLQLEHANRAQSRFYIVDLKRGYATILSKAEMPVYQIADLEKFNRIVNESGIAVSDAG